MNVLCWLLIACEAPASPGSSTPAWLTDVDEGPSLGATVDPFAWDAVGSPVVAGASTSVRLRLVVPAGHHAYADAISVTPADPAGLVVGAASLPAPELRVDPATGDAERPQYSTDTWIQLPISAPAGTTAGPRVVKLDVTHQGCRLGLCFPPKTTRVEVIVPVRPPGGG